MTDQALQIYIPEEGTYQLVRKPAVLAEVATPEAVFLKALGPKFFSVGTMIRVFRQMHDWTLRDLGKKSGIDHAQIHRYENNKKTPDPETISSLEKALGEAFGRAVRLLPEVRLSTEGEKG